MTKPKNDRNNDRLYEYEMDRYKKAVVTRDEIIKGLREEVSGQYEIINILSAYIGLRKTQEELMELYDAIGGYLSGADTEEHVKEESADAEVMIDQIKLLLNCWDEVNDIKRYKVSRQLKRMEA